MGTNGVNRIVIAVRDIESAKRQYHELLGASFVDADWTGNPFGISVAIAWDAGIELCAPLPGRETDSAVSQFLAARGEGIMSVFFNVDDADAAMEKAAAQGYGCIHSLDYTQGEIDQNLGGLFRKYQEFVIDTSARCGFAVSLARIEKKTDD